VCVFVCVCVCVSSWITVSVAVEDKSGSGKFPLAVEFSIAIVEFVSCNLNQSFTCLLYSRQLCF